MSSFLFPKTGVLLLFDVSSPDISPVLQAEVATIGG